MLLIWTWKISGIFWLMLPLVSHGDRDLVAEFPRDETPFGTAV